MLRNATPFILFYGIYMEDKDPILRVSINYESQAEKEYLDNILIPRLTACYMHLDLHNINNYYVINSINYRFLTHVLMNINTILQNYVAVDYCEKLGFVVWFDIPNIGE